MKLNLLSCDTQRPDRRAIAKCITEISSNVDDSLSHELTSILLEGDAIDIEVEDKKGGGMPAEAVLLHRAIPKGAHIINLDERGLVMTSPQFAQDIASVRDKGVSDLAFVIGGADGIDPALRAQADSALSFGQMVWPHMLVRVMLAEQLYRAASILGGSPYHRS